MFPPIKLVFPWPPTVNTYYRNVKGRTIMSKAGRMYRGVCNRCCVWQSFDPVPANARGQVVLNLLAARAVMIVKNDGGFEQSVSIA